jgi:hypothetical protein
MSKKETFIFNAKVYVKFNQIIITKRYDSIVYLLGFLKFLVSGTMFDSLKNLDGRVGVKPGIMDCLEHSLN